MKPPAASRRHLLGLIIAATVIAVLPRGPSAQHTPEAVVETLVRHIIDLLESGELRGDEGIERLSATIDEETDLDRLGRLVLGQHWRSADEAQQTEYLGLFRQLMLRKFVGHLGAYSGEGLGASEELFGITGSRAVGGDDVLVESTVDPPDRPPIAVAWRLRPQDGGWVIIDMIVENVSLLISQRSEFATVIERSGIDGLLTEMRERLARFSS